MKKNIAIISALIIVTGASLWWLFFGSLTITDITDYEKLSAQKTPMPAIAEFNNCVSMQYSHRKKNLIIFTYDSYALTAKYADSYVAEKRALDEKYVFQTESISDEGHGSIEPDFSVGTFSFRTLSVSEYDDGEIEYPKKLMFIGTSDETKEIVYLYYVDDDLDYIGTGLSEFVEDIYN